MQNLAKYLGLKKYKVKSIPIIFNLELKQDQKNLQKILKENQKISVIDTYYNQMEELFIIQNPSLINNNKLAETATKNYINALSKKAPLFRQGRWVYFPWLNTLIHILEERDFFLVRTSRNNHLITPGEQKKIYNSKVGIAGLSIGSSVATALTLQGGARLIKLADFDRLALSNTNRIRAGTQNLGLLKVEITARQIYEINPYAKIEIFPEGITKKNVNKFLKGLDILVDEVDSLPTKLLLRSKAKKFKLPVVMGADNGNSAVVDIERYDLNKNLKFFHNRLGKITFDQLNNLNKFRTGRLIAKLIGPESHDERMLTSLMEMGKSIVSWPQLGGTAMLNGAAVAYCIRKIITGQELENKRATVSLDKIFIPSYSSEALIKKRTAVIKNFKKILNYE